MKLFNLQRTEDESGISGTGVVAQGCEFDDGSVVLKWVVDGVPSSIGFYDSIADVELIHGHGGRTRAAVVVAVAPITQITELPEGS